MGIQPLSEVGNLLEEIKNLENHLKSHPADIEKRDLFQTLLCIFGDLERADQQLSLIIAQDPETKIFAQLQRQLIQAEKKRSACYFEGQTPVLPNNLHESLVLYDKAWRYRQKGQFSKAHECIQDAEKNALLLEGKCNGKFFKGLRDIDDLCASLLEVYLPGGIYGWFAFEDIQSITFHPPKRLIDLVWIKASISTHNNNTWEAYIPAIYASTPTENVKARLSQTTHWIENEKCVTGIGQRLWLVGNEALPILQIREIVMEKTK